MYLLDHKCAVGSVYADFDNFQYLWSKTECNFGPSKALIWSLPIRNECDMIYFVVRLKRCILRMNIVLIVWMKCRSSSKALLLVHILNGFFFIASMLLLDSRGHSSKWQVHALSYWNLRSIFDRMKTSLDMSFNCSINVTGTLLRNPFYSFRIMNFVFVLH